MNHIEEVAYLCAEYGFDGHPCSGGLGILSGDYVKSASDLGLPLIAVGLHYSLGNFHQRLSGDGRQEEYYLPFVHTGRMTQHSKNVGVHIQDREVSIDALEFDVHTSVPGESNFVPVIYLYIDHPQSSRDSALGSKLYPGKEDRYTQLAQEAILGGGSVRILRELGYHNIKVYHLNEGHAALAVLELMSKEYYGSLEEARKHVVFTTHTPVPAGIDIFDRVDVEHTIPRIPNRDQISRISGTDDLHMMRLAMGGACRSFGVSRLHRDVSRNLFCDFPNMQGLDYIDNGVHLPTWTHTGIQDLYDKLTDGAWRKHPKNLELAILDLSEEEVLGAHKEPRETLAGVITSNPGGKVKGNAMYDPEKLTIGFARRFATYKQATLVFDQIDRLRRLGKDVQFVFSGKAHPSDNAGKEVIKEIFKYMREFERDIAMWFIEDYDMTVARYMVQGVDLWLNTPRRLEEAAGTSGMKCAANLIPQFSIIDGWFVPQDPPDGYRRRKGLIEGETGWGIGRMPTEADFLLLRNEQARQRDREIDGEDLITKLGEVIVPLWKHKKEWARVMRGAGTNASWFNTHRMAREYFKRAYHISI